MREATLILVLVLGLGCDNELPTSEAPRPGGSRARVDGSSGSRADAGHEPDRDASVARDSAGSEPGDSGSRADAGSPEPTRRCGPTEAFTTAWTSILWSNGHERSWDGHEEPDPDDPVVQLAAGAGRLLTIDGMGTATLEGTRARMYLLVPHRNVEMEFYARSTDSALENISTKLRSRHQEGGDPENRFGGYGVVFHYDEPSVDFKIEYYHNDHSSGIDHRLPRALEHGTRYGFCVRIESDEDDSHAIVTAYIDYEADGTFEEVASETYERTGYLRNDLDARYTWIRTNSGDAIQRGVEFDSAVIRTF